MSTRRILLLRHLKIHNANALSSPYTIGFPAMTAWLGGVHALQRKLNQDDCENLQFTSVGVVCHKIDLQTYKGRGDFVHSIVGTGNPLDEKGGRPSFIEEARCHLDVSLAIECDGLPLSQEALLEVISLKLNAEMKFAGGDLLDFHPPEIVTLDAGETPRKITQKLMPGYALLERKDLMLEAMRDGKDALDALLDCLSIKHRSQEDENGDITWTSQRKQGGWIVPIATGFQGITPLLEAGETKNQRDPDTAHRFAESVVTLGEFVMVYRIQNLEDLLWHYHFDKENNLYLCQQKKNQC